ncbi:hypothetical protein ACIQZB_21945 [Streptomyces sp. NPDC097727]|uniref:hypothetical protein n=1 Tax=Streptomyces sp. NPDC097727 TaxID=3366092 RepID=UPI003829B111
MARLQAVPPRRPREPDAGGDRRRGHVRAQVPARDQLLMRRRDDDAEPLVLKLAAAALVDGDLRPGSGSGDRHGAAGGAAADHPDA